ncbi:MAG: FHA domain-containing protein [Rhodocyclaceae bacterium]
MKQNTEICVLVAEIVGDAPLVGKLGQVEANRAVERCRARAARSVDAYQGQILQSEGRRLVAGFARADSAMLAAQDIRLRIGQLPPVSGVMLAVRCGIAAHAGVPGEPPDDALRVEAQALAETAISGDILLTAGAAQCLSDGLRGGLNEAADTAPAGDGALVYQLRAGVLSLREVTHPPAVEPAAAAASAAQTAQGADKVASPSVQGRMMLRHQGSSFIISDTHPVLLAGREEGNDIVIVDRRASRQHARIEWRAGRYILIDSSTNGTYLVDARGVETILRRSECELPTTGRLGFGYSPQELGVEVALFDIGQR